MWIVAGILLAMVVIGLLAGFHVGPHAHVGAAIAGVIAAAWLLVMLALGDTRPLLYVLLAADVSVTGLAGIGAWRVIRDPGALAETNKPSSQSVAGKLGVATSDLDPEGIVTVRGEQWSAVSLNGRIPAGREVQVINADGVRLEVWGEEPSELPSPELKDERTIS